MKAKSTTTAPWRIGSGVLFMALLLFKAQTVLSQTVSSPEEPPAGAVVCAPNAYLIAPEDCLLAGPSVYLTELARIGLTIPPRPLPALLPDRSLNDIPYRYFRLDRDVIPLYSTLADAQAKGPPALVFPPGFAYISYRDRIDTGRGIYYQTQQGYWIPGKGARVGVIPTFQGLLFYDTPQQAFGWTIEGVPVKAAPGYFTPETDRFLPPETVVQVYATQEADGMEWYLIGPDEWIEGRKAGIVLPNPTPPEGVTWDRWIEVDLKEQVLAVYEGGHLIFATLIASGAKPFWTRPGLFQIYEKKERETMRNNDPSDFYYLEDVPYTMYFDGPRALHGAYWRTRFGFPQSHGCVNLSIGDARWLFDWARLGDWVYVHDPSGQTPTDPALYQGGAY